MKRVAAILIIIAVAAFSAEDATETTPPRLGPAVGVTNAPLSVGYRIPFTDYRSLDLAVRIPEFYKNTTGGLGFSLGGVIGYNVPIRIEENIAFVVKPQLDLEYLTEDFDYGAGDFTVNTMSLRPGAFMGVEVFLEEVGIENVNIALGFTTGMEFNIVDTDGSAKSTFHFPKASWPYGATVAVWWYF